MAGMQRRKSGERIAYRDSTRQFNRSCRATIDFAENTSTARKSPQFDDGFRRRSCYRRRFKNGVNTGPVERSLPATTCSVLSRFFFLFLFLLDLVTNDLPIAAQSRRLASGSKRLINRRSPLVFQWKLTESAGTRTRRDG